MPEVGATKYATSGDLSVAYQVIGDGPLDLIYVPGIVSHVEFFHQLPGYSEFLDGLASFARLIVFDKRGNGLSDRVAKAPTLEERMDDIRAVMDAVGSERATLFAVSEGGPISLLFAATYPARVEAIVLYETFVCYGGVPGELEGHPSGPDAHAEFTEMLMRTYGTGESLAGCGDISERGAAGRVVVGTGRATLEQSGRSALRLRRPVRDRCPCDPSERAGSVLGHARDHYVDVRAAERLPRRRTWPTHDS